MQQEQTAETKDIPPRWKKMVTPKFVASYNTRPVYEPPPMPAHLSDEILSARRERLRPY